MLFPRFAPCLMLGIYRHSDDGEFSLEFISYFPDFRHSRQADAAPACPEIHQNILVSWHYINKVTQFSIHVLKFQIHEFATLCGLLGERYTLAEFIHPQRVLRDVRNGLLQMLNLSACQIISTFQQIVGKINGNHGMRMRVEAVGQATAVACGDILGCGHADASTEGTESFGAYMAVLAQAMPVSTKDLHYDRRIPEACGRQTGDCLRVLLKRVQNQELVNDADVLAEAARRWLKRHEGAGHHG